MDRMHKYIDLYYPIENCNFDCDYCYVHEHRDSVRKKYVCSHSPEEIRTALSCKRLGGKCLINLCAGGETLLYPEIFDIIEQLLLEGHYISVVTNGTITKNIRLIERYDEECRKHLFFKFSFHYNELKKRELLETFFNNILYVKKMGCSFTLELPAYDEFIEERENIIALCREKLDDEVCHVTALRDESKSDFALLSKYDFNEYKKNWESFHSQMFDVRTDVIERRYKGFCYAGEWTFTANIETGEIRQCYYERILGNLYENPKKKLKLCAVGNHCHSSYCYACHAFLCLGTIPELGISIRYDETRDRNGKWLNDEMREFMHQSLAENHSEYNALKKKRVNGKNTRAERTIYKTPLEYSNKVMIEMKELEQANNYAIVEARHNARIMYKRIPKELQWIFNDMPKEKCEEGERIIVKALNSPNERAEGNEIWIVGALIDDVWYAAENLFDHTWIKRMRMLGWNGYTENLPDNVWGMVPKGKHITLVFEGNRWRGKCEIEYKGKKIEIDTFAESDNDLVYIELEN